MSAAAEDFIRQRLALTPLPFRADITLYLPTPGSGLTRWLAETGQDQSPPYWAYAWAGGAVLALHLEQHPELVAGRSVLDFGAGSGMLAIAAHRAGAASVRAFEPDPVGRIACRLNAEANGVPVSLLEAPQRADVVLAGDVFYDPEIATAALGALRDLAAAGSTVLVGDPFRRHLPLSKLTLLAQYDVPDMGGRNPVHAGVFALRQGTIGHARPGLEEGA